MSATNSLAAFACNAMVHDNRAAKKLAFITSWENAKKAEMEAELKKIEVS